MCTMAICTASDLFGIAKSYVLAMVTGKICFRRNGGHMVTRHPFRISMTLQTGLGVDRPALCSIMNFADRMKTVAIRTSRCVIVSTSQCLEVNGFEISGFFRVTLTT